MDVYNKLIKSVTIQKTVVESKKSFIKQSKLNQAKMVVPTKQKPNLSGLKRVACKLTLLARTPYIFCTI